MVSRVKLARVKKELSQVQLAELTTLSQGKISLIERGVVPKPDEAAMLAHILGVPAAELFPEIYASSGPAPKVVRKPYKKA